MAFPELTLLLHQALEPRLTRLLGLGRSEGWERDPECLHQVRVASRRVRAVLDLVDPGVYRGFRRHERSLRCLTKALGSTREMDVHLGLLEAIKLRDPEILHGALIEHVQELLERRRLKTCKPLNRELRSISIEDLAGLLEDAKLPSVLITSEQRLGAWQCLEPLVLSLQDSLLPLLEQEDIAALHAFRIQVKKLRYTLEILEPAFPVPLDDWLQRLKALQTALGEHHDLAMLEAALRDVQISLAEHGRNILATAALELMDAVAQDRRARYERFHGLCHELAEAMLYFNLKRLLMVGDQP
jgi:CHAD domain-containing protein